MLDSLLNFLSMLGEKVVEVYQMFEFDFWGIKINLWQLALWTLIAVFVIDLIKKLVDL